VTLLFRVIVDAGFTRYLIQRPRLPLIYADTAFWMSVTVAFVFTGIAIAVAPYFALLFGIPRLTIVIRVLSSLFILTALDATQSGLLDRNMQFRVQAIRNLVATASAGLVAVAMALAGAGVWALVAQQLALESVTVVLLWRLSPWRPRLRASRACLRDLVPFGARMSTIRVTQFAMTNADNFFVGIVFGKVALGFYVIAYRMFSVLNDLLITVINRVALSTFSRLQHDKELVNSAFYRASRLGSILTLPTYVGLALLARQVIIMLFGAQWTTSAPLLSVLMIAAFAQGQLTLCGSYATGIGWIRNEFRWTVSIAALQVAAFAVAAHFSVFAVATSVGVVLMAAWPFRLLPLRKLGGIHLREYFAHYPRLAVSTLVMAAGVFAIKHEVTGLSPVAALAIEVPAGVILLFGSLRVLAPRLLSELGDTARTLRPSRGT
jgi:PST family polysaccharide transporter